MKHLTTISLYSNVELNIVTYVYEFNKPKASPSISVPEDFTNELHTVGTKADFLVESCR